MLLHGEPCIASGIYCKTGVADRVHLYKYIGIYCITGGRTCINSRLLIAINWQNWVKLPPASLLWLLHRRTTHCLTATTLPYILHLLHRATCYSATSSYVLQGATVVLDFKLSVMRLELDKLLPGRLRGPVKAPWEHLGPELTLPETMT